MSNQYRTMVSCFVAVFASACTMNTDVPNDSEAAEDDLSFSTAEGRSFRVIPGNVPVFGRSITRWTEKWWRWLSEVPAPQNPELDPATDCANGQDDPVFFLPPLQAPSFQRRCRARRGRPVLVAVQAALNSYPCPDPSFEPAPGQTLEDFLREGVIAYNNLYSDYAVTIDGEPVDLAEHRHTTPLFVNTVHPSLLPHIPDPCLTGSSQPAVGDGFYFVSTLSSGRHRIQIAVKRPDGQPAERIYDVDVGR